MNMFIRCTRHEKRIRTAKSKPAALCHRPQQRGFMQRGVFASSISVFSSSSPPRRPHHHHRHRLLLRPLSQDEAAASSTSCSDDKCGSKYFTVTLACSAFSIRTAASSIRSPLPVFSFSLLSTAQREGWWARPTDNLQTPHSGKLF